MKKTLIFIGIGLIILIIAASIILGFFIGPIIKAGIERIGPQVTQVSIKLDSVDVSILTGTAKVKGLVVGNPSGYQSPHAITLGTASISLDPFSVLSNKILIHTIHIESPEITYETSLGSSNLTKIMDNVNAVARRGGPSSESANKNEPAPKPAPKIKIDDILITRAKVNVGLKVISSKDMSLSLPDIHLTDLGKESNGTSATELIRTVLSEITKVTVKEVTSTVTNSGKMIKGLGKDLHSITKGLGGLLKN